ncbi:MAG: hypothetical protein HY907_17190 [Deltaproteobacteria bacterium]|nr:hypothetical protein [Deltaproteobacteria bacterium]
MPGSYLARIDRSSPRVDVPDVDDLALDLEVPASGRAEGIELLLAAPGP